MALAIPLTTDSSLREGDFGLATFALQVAANKLGINTKRDFDFGPATTASAIKLQQKIGVDPDGFFGPVSQATLCQYLCNKREGQTSTYLPKGLLISLVNYESGGLLGAVNWAVAGGVDVGATQRRIYTSQYGDDQYVMDCFDPVLSIAKLANEFAGKFQKYSARPAVKGNGELATRLAVLEHNYPAAADTISKLGIDGLSSYWTTSQKWITDLPYKIKFPDGHVVTTPLEWCQRYSLGSVSHKEPGQAVRLVRSY